MDGFGFINQSSRSLGTTNYTDDDIYYSDQNRNDILKLVLYDLNSSIAPRELRIMAINAALDEFDHDDEVLHDEELELRADHILLQKLTYAMCIEPGSLEVGYLCAALEMVYRAGRTRLAQSFHEICDSILPLFVAMIRRPPMSLEGGSAGQSKEGLTDVVEEDGESQDLLGEVSQEQQHQIKTMLGDDDDSSAESVTIPAGTGEYFDQMKQMQESSNQMGAEASQTTESTTDNSLDVKANSGAMELYDSNQNQPGSQQQAPQYTADQMKFMAEQILKMQQQQAQNNTSQQTQFAAGVQPTSIPAQHAQFESQQALFNASQQVQPTNQQSPSMSAQKLGLHTNSVDQLNRAVEGPYPPQQQAQLPFGTYTNNQLVTTQPLDMVQANQPSREFTGTALENVPPKDKVVHIRGGGGDSTDGKGYNEYNDQDYENGESNHQFPHDYGREFDFFQSEMYQTVYEGSNFAHSSTFDEYGVQDGDNPFSDMSDYDTAIAHERTSRNQHNDGFNDVDGEEKEYNGQVPNDNRMHGDEKECGFGDYEDDEERLYGQAPAIQGYDDEDDESNPFSGNEYAKYAVSNPCSGHESQDMNARPEGQEEHSYAGSMSDVSASMRNLEVDESEKYQNEIFCGEAPGLHSFSDDEGVHNVDQGPAFIYVGSNRSFSQSGGSEGRTYQDPTFGEQINDGNEEYLRRQSDLMDDFGGSQRAPPTDEAANADEMLFGQPNTVHALDKEDTVSGHNDLTSSNHSGAYSENYQVPMFGSTGN
eukprot:scaffold1700_cov181-Alexandrium_tamarense.AAC.1